MIFLDTSAIYAWADAADPNHHTSVRRLQAILERGEELLTHNYVLVESLALLQSRLGVRELERSKKRHVSLVDHVSFLVMKRRQLAVAFAFDPDFTAAGFRLFDA